MPVCWDGLMPSSSYLPSTTSRLARLIKTMRRRWVAEQPTMEMWLEAAQEFESEVTSWLAELPPKFRLSSTVTLSDQPENPFVVAQQCELAAIANALFI